MKHVKTFEAYINEITVVDSNKVKDLMKKVKERVKNSGIVDKIQKYITIAIVDPYIDYETLSMRLLQDFPKVFKEDPELKLALENFSIDEGSLYDVKKTIKKGKMHALLNVPQDKEITDVYDDPVKLAEDLVKATGDKKEATGMLAFAANINPKENIFDKALRAMPKVKSYIKTFESFFYENKKLIDYDDSKKLIIVGLKTNLLNDMKRRYEYQSDGDKIHFFDSKGNHFGTLFDVGTSWQQLRHNGRLDYYGYLDRNK